MMLQINRSGDAVIGGSLAFCLELVYFRSTLIPCLLWHEKSAISKDVYVLGVGCDAL